MADLLDYGHAIGDEVLKEIAMRLERAIRKEDTIARLGGDEFAVVMESLKEAEGTMHCVQRLNAAFKEPVIVGDAQFVLSASIGISLYPQNGTDAHTLLRNADTAMFKAKEAGRGTFQFYVEEMTRYAVERARMEADLREAVERGELERCQPWRAKRRLVDPSSREAALFSRRALRQRENKVGLRTRRPVIGRQVRSSNELAKLLRSAW